MQDIYTKESDLSKAVNEGQEKLKNVANEAQNRLKQGQEQVQQMIAQADKQLHENPWPIVAGVAVACLFLGFFAGNARRD